MVISTANPNYQKLNSLKNNILKLITMPLAFTFIKEVNREHILDIIAEL